MNRVRYTASGRLGVWDSIDKPGMEEWRSQLDELLQSNAHGVIESDVLDFTETDDPALAASTAICDKIISRGNPTLAWIRTGSDYFFRDLEASSCNSANKMMEWNPFLKSHCCRRAVVSSCLTLPAK